MSKATKELKRIRKAPRKVQRDFVEALEHNSVDEAEEFSRGFESSLRRDRHAVDESAHFRCLVG